MSSRKPNLPIPEWVEIGIPVRNKWSGYRGVVKAIDEYFVDVKYDRSAEISHEYRGDPIDETWYPIMDPKVIN